MNNGEILYFLFTVACGVAGAYIAAAFGASLGGQGGALLFGAAGFFAAMMLAGQIGEEFFLNLIMIVIVGSVVILFVGSVIALWGK